MLFGGIGFGLVGIEVEYLLDRAYMLVSGIEKSLPDGHLPTCRSRSEWRAVDAIRACAGLLFECSGVSSRTARCEQLDLGYRLACAKFRLPVTASLTWQDTRD